MNAATLYDLVRVLHLGADIVFTGGLLAGVLALAALSFQSAADLAQERRLVAGLRGFNRIVTGPALVVLWACGLWLAWRAGWFASGWLQAKLGLVLVLSVLFRSMMGVIRIIIRFVSMWSIIPHVAWPIFVLKS